MSTWAEANARAAKNIRIIVRFDEGAGETIPAVSNGAIQNKTSTITEGVLRHIGNMQSSVVPQKCKTSISGTSFEVVDRNQFLTALLSSYDFRTRVVTFELGYHDVDEADFEVVFKGRVSSISSPDGTFYRFQCGDLRHSLKKMLFTSATEASPATFSNVNPFTQLLSWLTDSGANGLDIDSDLIDSTTIEAIRDDYFSGLQETFVATEPMEAKAWIEEQICQPHGVYLTTKANGQISMKKVQEPFWIEAGTNVINAADVIGPIQVDCDLRDLLNEIYWQTDYDYVDDEFDEKTIEVNSTSVDKFLLSRRSTIEAKGLTTSAHSSHISRITRSLFARFADPFPRYRFKLKMSFNQISEGDLYEFNAPNTPDLGEGFRGISGKLIEILSVQKNITKGEIQVEATGTPFEIKKTAVISPASVTHDYASATADEKRKYAWIGRASDNKVGSGTDEGYVIHSS